MPEEKISRIEVLDYVRGLAIVHIFLYHYYIEWFQGSFLLVVGGVGPNLQRLAIFHDAGFVGFLKNAFSFLWVYGFASVNLFLLLSGFVLTYSTLKNEKKEGNRMENENSMPQIFEFYRKKLRRLLTPFYVTLVIGIGILYLRNVLFPMFAGPPVFSWTDAAKVMFVPFLVYDVSLLQRFNGDLWFITLIMQLYLLFPLLYAALKRFGLWKFLGGCFALTVLYRVIATYFLSTAPMGVIYSTENSYYLFSFFLPRLLEFALGMTIGVMQFRDERFVIRFAGRWKFLFFLIVMLAGFWLDTYKIGWSISDPVISIGLFFVLLNIGFFFAKLSVVRRMMLWLGASSYETFLLHHYMLNYLLMPFMVVVGLRHEVGFWLFLPVFFVIAAVTGWVGQKISTALSA
jgi:peptidoglycan/LPS O-acetylase OafA/YrhL